MNMAYSLSKWIYIHQYCRLLRHIVILLIIGASYRCWVSCFYISFLFENHWISTIEVAYMWLFLSDIFIWMNIYIYIYSILDMTFNLFLELNRYTEKWAARNNMNELKLIRSFTFPHLDDNGKCDDLSNADTIMLYHKAQKSGHQLHIHFNTCIYLVYQG